MTNQDSPLASFLSELLAGSATYAPLYHDNARSHSVSPKREALAPSAPAPSCSERISRWESNPCDDVLVEEERQIDFSASSRPMRKSRRSRINRAETETLIVEEVPVESCPSKCLRMSRRSRINRLEEGKLNKDRFAFDGASEDTAKTSPKQPRRQLTPDINVGIENILAATQQQRQAAKEEVVVANIARRHSNPRKPIRQLTPPNTEAAKERVARRGSPTTAMIPDKLQFVRQGSLD